MGPVVSLLAVCVMWEIIATEAASQNLLKKKMLSILNYQSMYMHKTG